MLLFYVMLYDIFASSEWHPYSTDNSISNSPLIFLHAFRAFPII
jgi:hypothetical protein